jgi:hypothetical protein
MGWRCLLELPALLLVQMCREISDDPPVVLEIEFTLPNRYYRDDIGERWMDEDGDRLLAWGYLGP